MQKSPKTKRWILQTLILSGILNALLLGLFLYFFIYDTPFSFSFLPEKEQIQSAPLSVQSLSQLQSLSFEELEKHLEDFRMIRDGYHARDLALASLVSFHHFDIERALGRGRLVRRKWLFGEQAMVVFPGLTDEDFQLVRKFIRQERYPFTTCGIFEKIKGGEAEPALLSYFFHSPQFVQLEILFSRAQVPIQRKKLLDLVVEGGWERLDRYYAMQERGANFSAERRRALLCDYMGGGSVAAASLLLVTDFQFAVQNLEDSQVSQLLDLLDGEEIGTYCQIIALSPRSDEVRKKASGRCSPEVSAKFYNRPAEGELRPVFRERPPVSTPTHTHVIQPGESLWMISKRYQVPVEVLMRVNHLPSTQIQSGKLLTIPPP